jgi:hypothetical protein
MSYNRTLYDPCEANLKIKESMNVGNYSLNTPIICGNCFQENPRIIDQKTGVSMNSGVEWRFYAGPVDIESDLKNINKQYSKCPSNKYNPSSNDVTCNNQGYPSGQGVVIGCKNKKTPLKKPWSRGQDNNLVDFPKCFFPTEDTRLSNPPTNLRGTGINRFNPLCLDPQAQVLFPVNSHISTRIVVKDNHRPCIPKPDVNSMKPPISKPPCQQTTNVCGAYTAPMYQYDVCG